MATLKDIQSCELGILKYLDSVCRKHNLSYSLIGGSMLGAVRHHGFIPWDDDIDVYMPASDCLKLQKLCIDQNFFLQSPETDLCMPFIMYKLRKNGTRMIEPGTEGLQIHRGIWLDIFPYCNAARTQIGRKAQRLLLAVLQTYRCRFRYVDKPRRRFLHFLLAKMPRWMQLWIDRAIFNFIRFLGNRNSQEIFAFDVGKVMFFQKSYFANSREYDFEDMKAVGIRDYDDYLSFVFGNDYMTPRQWGHLDNYDDVVV